MATVKSSLVVKTMRERNYPMFEIWDGNLLLSEQKSDRFGIDAAIDKMNETLQEVSGNDISIVICGKLNATGGFVRGHSITFDRVDITPQKKETITGTTDNYNHASVQKYIDKNLELEKKILSMEFDAKYNDLKREMEAIRSEKNGGINGVLTNLIENPAIQNVIGNLLSSAMGVPATSGARVLNGVTSDAEDCINRLLKVDPKFLYHLALLAELAEKAPDTYKQAIAFLNMQFASPTIES